MPSPPDGFSRPVYCLLGVPIDNVAMADVVSRIFDSARSRQPFFLSTPNLNFVALAQRDKPFRDSILASDLCPVDGMGAVALCRLLGLPKMSRVAGSDIPKALNESAQSALGRPFNIAFFGGDSGVARRACETLNSNGGHLKGVCAIDPGKLPPERMRSADHVAALNASNADFLLVALGAQKGQSWIMQNRTDLAIPAFSHLGATINFIAGTVKRAPAIFQKSGMEWLWRIKEEPRLANRYFQDGKQVAKLLLTRVLPLRKWLNSGRRKYAGATLKITSGSGKMVLAGAAGDHQSATFAEACRSAAQQAQNLSLDVTDLAFFDLRFAGLLLVLEHELHSKGRTLKIMGAQDAVARALGYCGLSDLLAPA